MMKKSIFASALIVHFCAMTFSAKATSDRVSIGPVSIVQIPNGQMLSDQTSSVKRSSSCGVLFNITSKIKFQN